MSAARLREAASSIRHDVDFGQQHGDAAFLLAVAKWLDECGSAPNWEVDDLSWLFEDAITIADAYLGSAS